MSDSPGASGRLDRLIEGGGEFGVAVVLDVEVRGMVGRQLADECAGLLDHPGFVGAGCARSDEHAAGFHMEKHNQEQVSNSACRQRPDTQHVGLPKRGGVTFQKVVPGAIPAFRRRFEIMFAQDVANRTARWRSQVQLLQFADDPRRPPSRVFPREFHNQLPQILERARSAEAVAITANSDW